MIRGALKEMYDIQGRGKEGQRGESRGAAPEGGPVDRPAAGSTQCNSTGGTEGY